MEDPKAEIRALMSVCKQSKRRLVRDVSSNFLTVVRNTNVGLET